MQELKHLFIYFGNGNQHGTNNLEREENKHYTLTFYFNISRCLPHFYES